jgi:hypothetical protein
LRWFASAAPTSSSVIPTAAARRLRRIKGATLHRRCYARSPPRHRDRGRHRAVKHPPESLVQSSRSTATLMSTGASAGNPSAGFLLAEQRPFVSPGSGVGARGLDQRPSSHQQVGIVTPLSAPLP